MKKVLIIHGWQSGSQEHWYQEEKKILENLCYKVTVPDMPNANYPNLNEWIQIIEDFCPDKDSILIGHSLGAPTILRYLESTKKKVEKIILIAGFASTLNLDYPDSEYPDSFVKDSFNWGKIKENSTKIIVINQKKDDWVPFKKGIEIAKNTQGELVEVEGTDHFDKMDLDLINSRL